MPVSVTMPQLGESVSEGTITRWLKNEGDHVEADEPLLEISTDKVDTEIPAPASGTLTSIRVREDETVEVGVELALIEPVGARPQQPEAPAETTPPEPSGGRVAERAEEPTAPPAAGQAPPSEDQRPAASEAVPEQERPEEPTRGTTSTPRPSFHEAPAVTAPPPAAPDSGEPAPTYTPPSKEQQDVSVPDRPAEDEISGAYITPLVRKLAAEHNVDLSTVQGTGVGGRIRKQDVLEAARTAQVTAKEAEAPVSRAEEATERPEAQEETRPPTAAAPAAPAALRGRTEKMSRLRTLIARRMMESLQTSAQLTTVIEVDVTRIARLRDRAKDDFERREGVKLSFLPFFALATVEALKQHVLVNASIDAEAGTITYHDAEHLGIAVDTERGLLVPVIHNAGDLNLAGMARKIADLATRARENRVTPDELGGGTFTLTNTGSRGVLFDTPIILQPQVGILGTGAVVKRPVVIDDAELGKHIAVRSMVYLALTYDHRIVDGADAARFLGAVKERLESGAFESGLGLV